MNVNVVFQLTLGSESDSTESGMWNDEKFILYRQVHIFILFIFLLCYLAWEKIVWTTYIKNAVKDNVKIGDSPCLLLTVIWEKEWVSVELISSGTFDVLHKQQELSSCCHKALC